MTQCHCVARKNEIVFFGELILYRTRFARCADSVGSPQNDGSTGENVAIPRGPAVSGWMLSMLAKLKLALVAAVLGGLVVVSAQTGSRAAVPVDPLGITPQETQQFKDLIDPAT